MKSQVYKLDESMPAGIFEQVRQLQDRVDQLVRATNPVIESTDPPNDAIEHIKPILELRARRQRFFGDSLFGEPAWDMLLELYEAKYRGRRVGVTSLCYGSGVPMTTALRWITNLERDGWVVRARDSTDHRRVWVDPTDKTIRAVKSLFAKSYGLVAEGSHS